ncbi:MAG: hypothetical protein N3A59_09205 [Thermodesulfovibrionales bacterium]|nr:hypothetical protein [Thermodesulfovibrionales bacterium]
MTTINVWMLTFSMFVHHKLSCRTCFGISSFLQYLGILSAIFGRYCKRKKSKL